MQVVNHRLCFVDKTPIQFRRSPNVGGPLQPVYVVLHYTAGSSASRAIGWMCNPDARASAHLVIDRDGVITQLVPFDTTAWHAGRSAWDGRTNLNKFSIGIELVNAGVLQHEDGKWVSWLGHEYPDDQVIEIAHKHHDEKVGWHKYTDAQVNVVREVVTTLFRVYDLKDVLGHDDIAPGKLDPGPAFPMAGLRSAIFGPSAGSEPAEERTKGLSPRHIFYSYAHEDEDYKNKLVEHLSVLKRRGYISEWHDRKIEAGGNWSKAISQNLESADIILLLVSSSFIVSEYCWEVEMKCALERHARGEATVVPIVLRPVLFRGAPFEKLQMLPKDAKPVSTWKNIDEAFVDIAISIMNLVVERA